MCIYYLVYLHWNELVRLIWWYESTGFASAAAAVRPPPADVCKHRNAIFSTEQARQRALYPRIEKIEVSMQGPGLDGTLLIMNKGMSTPLSCARREWSLLKYNLGENKSILLKCYVNVIKIKQTVTTYCTFRVASLFSSQTWRSTMWQTRLWP